MSKAPSRLLKPTEQFRSKRLGRGAPGITVGDYWRWAFSNLADNAVRGILAEFLVGTALGIRFGEPRSSWDDFDLMTPGGIRVEVKATGYLQAWESRGSTPVFSGLRGQTLTQDKAAYHGKRVVRSDVFVFSVQTETDPSRYNPLDLDQWRFYVVSGKRIEELDQDSIRLSRVEKFATSVGIEELHQEVERVSKTALNSAGK